MVIAPLRTDRTRAALSGDSLIGRLRSWSTELHSRGLHAEASTMSEAAAEIERLTAKP